MNGLGAKNVERKSIKRHLPLYFLLLAVGMFHVCTMPKFFYRGDNFAARAEAANLLNTGKLGIPFSQKTRLADLPRQRGQYFYENDAKQEFHSKYGIGYTLLYLVPLWAEKMYSGKLDLLCVTKSQLLFLNLYNVIFTLLATAYLYRIVSVYTSKTWQRIGFILISYYTTFLWHYLRTPSTEVFQLLPFLAFYDHLARFLRESRLTLPKETRVWMHMTLAVCFAGILLSMKPFFAPLFVVVGVLGAIMPGWTGFRNVFKGAFRNVLKYRYSYLRYGILPCAVIVASLLAVNHYKFGSIFVTGYDQWVQQGGTSYKTDTGGGSPPKTAPEGGQTQATDRFGMNPMAALHGFFLGRGNANAFVHYPVFVFALFGMKRFAKKFPVDLCLILSLFGLITLGLASYSGWQGGSCYGPRYLLLVLVIGSLPFLEVIDRMFSFQPLMKWCAIGVVASVLGWSLVMQVYMNSLDYFSFYGLRAFWTQFKQERVDAYFDNCFHRGLIHRDYILYIQKGKPYFPLEAVKNVLSARDRDRLIHLTQRHRIRRMVEPNYFFCKSRQEVDSR